MRWFKIRWYGLKSISILADPPPPPPCSFYMRGCRQMTAGSKVSADCSGSHCLLQRHHHALHHHQDQDHTAFSNDTTVTRIRIRIRIRITLPPTTPPCFACSPSLGSLLPPMTPSPSPPCFACSPSPGPGSGSKKKVSKKVLSTYLSPPPPSLYPSTLPSPYLYLRQ